MSDVQAVATPPAQRDYWLDNAKFILIVFVIAGHAIEEVWRAKPVLNALWTWIYFFHMPLFIAISGYFSKKPLTAERLYKLFVSLIVPFLIFQIVMFCFNCWLYEKKSFDTNMFRAFHVMWFLPALFLWRILAPVFTKIKYPLLTAIVVGLLVGFSVHLRKSFGMTRGLAFLPFFVLGLVIARTQLERLNALYIKIAAAIVLVGSFVLIYLYGKDINMSWVLLEPYANATKHVHWTIIFKRLAIYGGAFVLSASVLALIPRRKLFFSKAGSATLYPFLLHLLIVRVIFKYGSQVGFQFNMSGLEWIPWILVGSILIALLTTTRPVMTVFRPFMEPNPEKFRKYALLYLLIGFAFVTTVHEVYKPSIITEDYATVASKETITRFAKKDTIRIKLDGVKTNAKLAVTLGTNDSYTLVFFKKGKKIGDTHAKRIDTTSSGLSERAITVPKAVVAAGYDRIDIAVKRGDRTYEFKSLQLID